MRFHVACFLLGALFATSLAQKAKPTTKPTKPPPTADKLKCTVFNGTAKLTTELYKDTLTSPHNADFIRLRLEVEAGLMQVYENEKAFTGASVMKYEKAADGKAEVSFVIQFSSNSTHLAALVKQLATKKLGKLDVDAKLVKFGCYVPPPPPTCILPCPSLCAPTCGDSCCSQYAYPQPAYAPPPPPPPPVVVAPAPSCPSACAPACAPACTPSCCANTAYQASPYGKRTETHPGHKKHHKKN